MFDNIDDKWLNIIDINEIKKILKEIYKKTPKNKLCPHEKNILEFARLTPLETVKVIVIGQDCYQTEGYAQGIAFSTKQSKTPPALRNIYKCLYNSKLINSIPSGNNLECWAKQGVLLLNIGLTTEINKSGAHISYWRSYSQELIDRLCEYGKSNSQQYIFLLCGKEAQKINIPSKYKVFKVCHPSPQAQTRLSVDKRFENCDVFKKINNILVKNGDKSIDWHVC